MGNYNIHGKDLKVIADAAEHMCGNNTASTSSNTALYKTTTNIVVHRASPHQSQNNTVDSSKFSHFSSENIINNLH